MKRFFTFCVMALLSVVSLGQNVDGIIVLDKTLIEIYEGEEDVISVTISPQSESNKDVIFYAETSNPEVAVIDYLGNGMIQVIGIRAGITNVEISSSKNCFPVTCEVYVVRGSRVDFISSVTPYIELCVGERKMIEYQIIPRNADATVFWEIENGSDILSTAGKTEISSDILSVDFMGQVTGIGCGYTTLVARPRSNPNIEARYEVFVKSTNSPIIGSGKINISGTVFLDDNENGIQDGEEYGLPQQKLLILPDSVYTYTDNSGKYSFWCGTESIYHIIPLLFDNWVLTTETTFSSSNSENMLISEVSTGKTNVTGIDFGIKNIKDERKPEVSIITLEAGRCSETLPIILSFRNNGTVVEQGRLQLNLFPGMRGIVSASQNYDSISVDENTLYWNVNVRPFEKLFIKLIAKMPDFSFIGDTLESVVSYKDAQSVLSSDTANVVVRCSYDPNDKTVFPMGVTDENLVLMNEPLSYTIRFQNTGNDYAKNVVVIDTLSSALDLETFEVVAASHNLKTNYTSDGVVEFRFDNIMLLDSTTNEPESHGFVKYRIKAKKDLPDNTVIENTAHIYFDYNPAVVTNTTMNTMTYTILKNEESTAIEVPYNATVKLYPNPIRDYSVLEFDNAGNDLFQLTISDVTGKIINTMQTSGNSFIVGKGLDKGVYLYSLRNTQTNQVYRNSFIVE